MKQHNEFLLQSVQDKEKLLVEFIEEKDNYKGMNTKYKLQLDDLKDKNKRLIDENRGFSEKIRALEEKNASAKLAMLNLKANIKEKDNETNRNKVSANLVENLKQENANMTKKLDEQTKKMKQMQTELE